MMNNKAISDYIEPKEKTKVVQAEIPQSIVTQVWVKLSKEGISMKQFILASCKKYLDE